ncbi:MAG: hypothetical protein KAS59_00745 [Alphaproteobacteria bacterium]|nr:hypothetical protein [Alphaproteobacteria bacterium]
MTNIIRPNFKQHKQHVKYITVPAWVIADGVLNRQIMVIQQAGWTIETFGCHRHWEDIVCVNPEDNLRYNVTAAYDIINDRYKTNEKGA